MRGQAKNRGGSLGARAAIFGMSRPIEVSGLEKRYGTTNAVRGIDLAIEQGEVFGIIGPDGAGKTSTFHVLSGVMEATAGHVKVLGVSAREARSQIGYLTQAFSLYSDLSVWENVRYAGQIRSLPETVIRQRGEMYLQRFDLDRFTARLAGRLSGGMRQKLALACALLGQPRVLLLDEPTTGVDPVSRRDFWDTLTHLSGEGMTIVVATPYLDEAERCTRVALMHDGRIHDQGPPAELRRALGMQRLEVRATSLRAAEDLLHHISTGAGCVIRDVQRFGDRIDLLTREPEAAEATARAALSRAGIKIDEVETRPPTLENVFVTVLNEVARMPVDAHTPVAPSGPVPPSPATSAASEKGSPPASGAPERRPGEILSTAPGKRTTRVGDPAIRAVALGRTFGSFHAVKNVDLEIHYGEIYGLLGANGAGKTTTIKMLCGLADQTSGHVFLAGAQDRHIRTRSIRQRVGYMSQKFSLYDDLTIDENLQFFAGVYGISRAVARQKAERVKDFAGLNGKGNLLTGSLPGGWKQRVAFGAAVMHEPEVVFLDEPTSGVDPIARRAFWRVINQLADDGVAVLVTTHYLEEAEQCNRLGLMVSGELVAQGSPGDLKASCSGVLLVLETTSPQRAANLLHSHMERWRVTVFGTHLHVIVDEKTDDTIPALVAELGTAGISVSRASEGKVSLEDVFIRTVEKARQEGKVVDE